MLVPPKRTFSVMPRLTVKPPSTAPEPIAKMAPENSVEEAALPPANSKIAPPETNAPETLPPDEISSVTPRLT
jgi:hypothetical protein